MNLNQKKIVRILVIVFIFCIIGFLTINSVVQVHNTNDPHFAKKTVVWTMMIIVATIAAGCVALYYLRGQKTMKEEDMSE